MVNIGKTVWVMLFVLVVTACTTATQPVPTPTSTPTPIPQPTPTPLPYESIPGIYLGTFHGTSSPSYKLFEEIGKGVAISALYLDWSGGFNSGLSNAHAHVGRITFITWEYKPGMGGPMKGYEGRVLEAITDGVHDEYLQRWAEGVRDFGKPIFIRWSHEMNGDWYPWSGTKNGGGIKDGFGDPSMADGPERYVAAFRHIHDLFDEAGADNVLWVWCPNAPFESMQSSYGSTWNAAANYYPGDEYVDWLCFDGYNWGTSAFGQQFNSVWTEFDRIFAESYRQLNQINPDKPIIIGEFASTEDGGDKAAWITNALSHIENDYPQIRAIIWFHINKETDWRINSSPESLAAFSQAVASDTWLDEWPGMADE